MNRSLDFSRLLFTGAALEKLHGKLIYTLDFSGKTLTCSVLIIKNLSMVSEAGSEGLYIY